MIPIANWPPPCLVKAMKSPRGDQTGYSVLTPLRLANGQVVLVDRGWSASGAANAPDAGPVTVRGTLFAGQGEVADDAVRTVSGLPSVPRVDLARLGAAASTDLGTVWIDAESQDPAPGEDAPLLPEPPQPDQVNHMQYAIQWWLFSAGVPVGWAVLVRRERRDRAASAQAQAAPEAAPAGV